ERGAEERVEEEPQVRRRDRAAHAGREADERRQDHEERDARLRQLQERRRVRGARGGNRRDAAHAVLPAASRRNGSAGSRRSAAARRAPLSATKDRTPATQVSALNARCVTVT